MTSKKISGLDPGTTLIGDELLEMVQSGDSVSTTAAEIAALGDFLPTGGGTLTGALTLNADPSTALQAATKQYVDNTAAGLDVKPSVKCATTANITLSGEQTLDGILTSISRVLVKNQSSPAQNGLYTSAAGAWTRTTDMDAWVEVPGSTVWVEQGSTLADTAWVATADAGGTIGSTSITWAQFGGTGAFQATSAMLSAIAALSTTGIIVRTGSGTSTTRTITGTANEVTVVNGDGVSGDPVISFSAVGLSASVSFNRTADTNIYAVNDTIGSATGSTAALDFSGIAAGAGEVVITGATLEVDLSAIPSGMTTFTLHLYSITPPSAIGDNAGWDLPSGDRASYLGSINLGAPADLGSTLYASTDGYFKQVTAAGTHIFGYLVTNAIYTPASGTTYKVTLHSLAA